MESKRWNFGQRNDRTAVGKQDCLNLVRKTGKLSSERKVLCSVDDSDKQNITINFRWGWGSGTECQASACDADRRFDEQLYRFTFDWVETAQNSLLYDFSSAIN